MNTMSLEETRNRLKQLSESAQFHAGAALAMDNEEAALHATEASVTMLSALSHLETLKRDKETLREALQAAYDFGLEREVYGQMREALESTAPPQKGES